jgi:hypothetical protein
MAAVLLTLGAVISLLNWSTLFRTWWTGRFCSAVPLVGAACLGAGALLLPSLRPYAWAAVLLDFGTLALLLAAPRIAQSAWATSRFRLVEEYVGQRGATTVRLRLFRRGVFTLRWDIERPPGEYGLIGMGNVGTWERDGDTLVLRIGEDRAVFRPLPGEDRRGWRQSIGFGHCEQNPELSLEGLEFFLRV